MRQLKHLHGTRSSSSNLLYVAVYAAVVTYVLIEGISFVVGYFGVYGSLASLRTPQKCFCLVTDPCFCLVTDPSEVLLWTGKGFVVPHWGGLCHGRSFNDNMVNECLQSMHPHINPSLNPNEKLGGECNIAVPFRTPF